MSSLKWEVFMLLQTLNAFISKPRFSSWRPRFRQFYWTDLDETKFNRRRIVTILARSKIKILRFFLLFFFYTKLQKNGSKFDLSISSGRHFVKKNRNIFILLRARITSMLIITLYFFFKRSWGPESWPPAPCLFYFLSFITNSIKKQNSNIFLRFQMRIFSKRVQKQQAEGAIINL